MYYTHLWTWWILTPLQNTIVFFSCILDVVGLCCACLLLFHFSPCPSLFSLFCPPNSYDSFLLHLLFLLLLLRRLLLLFPPSSSFFSDYFSITLLSSVSCFINVMLKPFYHLAHRWPGPAAEGDRAVARAQDPIAGHGGPSMDHQQRQAALLPVPGLPKGQDHADTGTLTHLGYRVFVRSSRRPYPLRSLLPPVKKGAERELESYMLLEPMSKLWQLKVANAHVIRWCRYPAGFLLMLFLNYWAL